MIKEKRKDEYHLPLIHQAVWANDINWAKRILDSDSLAVKVGSPFGRTALFDAASRGNLNMVKLLIEYGADVSKTDANNWTPLLSAGLNNHLDVVKYLVARGASINTCIGKKIKVKEKWKSRTTLYIIPKRNREVIKYLSSVGGESLID